MEYREKQTTLCRYWTVIGSWFCPTRPPGHRVFISQCLLESIQLVVPLSWLLCLPGTLYSGMKLSRIYPEIRISEEKNKMFPWFSLLCVCVQISTDFIPWHQSTSTTLVIRVKSSLNLEQRVGTVHMSTCTHWSLYNRSIYRNYAQTRLTFATICVKEHFLPFCVEKQLEQSLKHGSLVCMHVA